jgi:hypothetical protein
MIVRGTSSRLMEQRPANHKHKIPRNYEGLWRQLALVGHCRTGADRGAARWIWW